MVFSIPSYLGLGDRPKRVVDERSKGVNFIVSYPKTGKGNDVYLDGGKTSNKYLWVGERGGGNAAETLQRREAVESAKKNLTPNGFVYTGPTKKGEGLGSYFGCFQTKPFPHVPNYPVKQQERLADAAARKAAGASGSQRGIYTSPAAKGSGYGYPGLTIAGEDYPHIAAFYDAPQRAARQDREAWAKKMPAEPFKPCGRRGFTFDESLATGVSKCYIMTVPFREKKPQKQLTHFVVAAPWKPAGYVDNAPLPVVYWEDPYGGHDPRREPKDCVKKPSDKYFLPSSRCDTFWYTQSVVFKRI